MQISIFFKRWDRDGDGFLEKKELIRMMPIDMIDAKFKAVVKKRMQSGSESFQSIYRNFDEDQEGYVDRQEFINGCATLKLGVLDEQAGALFDMWDLDKSGRIDITEFEKKLKGE